MQTRGKSLQQTTAVVEHVTHRDFDGIPVAFLQTKAYHAFINGLQDQKVKQHILMRGDCDPK